jgi:multicomponent Na+:H+ antiporter subunit D
MNSLFLQTVTSTSSVIWDWVFAGAFLVLMIVIGLYSIAIPQGKRGWSVLAALIGVLAIAGMVVGEGLARILLLDAAAFVAVALVWNQGTAAAKSAAKTYLMMMIIAVAFLGAGMALAGEGGQLPAYPLDKIAAGLLITGFAVKLALVPFYFWLPKVTEHSSPMTSALIISIVDIAAFCELAHLRLTATWVFTDYAVLWLVLALLSMFGGALLALAQKNIKRMLAFSTIDDMGYLVLGTLVGTQYGLNGAILAALSHAFFKVLLFGAVGIAEKQIGHDLTLDDRGMAAKNPFNAAVFILSAIGMIGVPPFFGFIGRWRLYLSGLEYGGVALILAMAAATALALLYYVRVVHRVWLGKPEEGIAFTAAPKLAVVVLIILLLVMLAVGLYPNWLTTLIG